MTSFCFYTQDPHLLRNGSLLFWQRSKSEVWLDNSDLRPDLLGIFSLDTWVNNDVLARYPVDWSSNLVLVTGLQAVDDAEHLGAVAAGGSWVGENGANGLLWVNDKDRADGECLENRVSHKL
jgi:hypothetical protein